MRDDTAVDGAGRNPPPPKFGGEGGTVHPRSRNCDLTALIEVSAPVGTSTIAVTDCPRKAEPSTRPPLGTYIRGITQPGAAPTRISGSAPNAPADSNAVASSSGIESGCD